MIHQLNISIGYDAAHAMLLAALFQNWSPIFVEIEPSVIRYKAAVSNVTGVFPTAMLCTHVSRLLIQFIVRILTIVFQQIPKIWMTVHVQTRLA